MKNTSTHDVLLEKSNWNGRIIFAKGLGGLLLWRFCRNNLIRRWPCLKQIRYKARRVRVTVEVLPE